LLYFRQYANVAGLTISNAACVAPRIRPIDTAALMGHHDVKTTLTVCAHLIDSDDHAGNMAALGALSAPAAKPSYGGNVIPLRG